MHVGIQAIGADSAEAQARGPGVLWEKWKSGDWFKDTQ